MPQESSYSDFQATHPLVFAKPTDPLEADSWLRTIEAKFGLLHCTDYKKTLHAAQQLRGSMGAWWENYTPTLLANHQVLWAEFCMAFRGYHILTGLMNRKQPEFLNLQQGSGSVYEYSKKFNYLA
jgi:hypothetical protein